MYSATESFDQQATVVVASVIGTFVTTCMTGKRQKVEDQNEHPNQHRQAIGTGRAAWAERVPQASIRHRMRPANASAVDLCSRPNSPCTMTTVLTITMAPAASWASRDRESARVYSCSSGRTSGMVAWKVDSERGAIVMDLLRKLAVEQQAAIIVVTHDEKILGRLDNVVQLRDGRMTADAEPVPG